MTFSEVYTMLSNIEKNGVKVPCAYYQFGDDTGQQPPFICFFYSGSDDFAADNSNYAKIESLNIELYTDVKDFELEAAVEATLRANSLTWERSEEFIDSEQMHETIYTTEVLINV